MSAAYLDELAGEASEAVRRLLQQAYERGYREALASAGAPPPERAIAEVVPLPTAGASTAAQPQVEWSSEEDADEEDDEPERRRVVLGIAPRASVGTLRRRIMRTFDLERFDIDVVICRRGDRDRRQLRSTAQLALYRREG